MATRRDRTEGGLAALLELPSKLEALATAVSPILFGALNQLTKSATLKWYLNVATIVAVLIAVAAAVLGIGSRKDRKRMLIVTGVLFGIGSFGLIAMLTLLNPDNSLPLKLQQLGDTLRGLTPAVNYLVAICWTLTVFGLSGLLRLFVIHLEAKKA